MKKHEETTNFPCPICQKILPSEVKLKAHVMVHTGVRQPHFKCTICSKKYANLQLLNAHVRYIHEVRGRFVCATCGKSFGTMSYLQAHEVSHDSIGLHLCEICGKSYKHKKVIIRACGLLSYIIVI